MTDPRTIDLNADLGEGFGIWRLTDDEALLKVVTSANVACGFHAGDPLGLRRIVARAASLGVVVGAQVSYRDLVGFGRRFLDASPEELAAEVVYQVGALDGLCRVEGTRVAYVKPHGALYAACTTHPAQGAALTEAAAAMELPLLHGLLPGAVVEAFIDRMYEASGTLVPRGHPEAVLHDPYVVVARAVELATTGTVVAADGTVLQLGARSLCLHGDTPGAVDLAHRVRAAIEEAGVVVRSFV